MYDKFDKSAISNENLYYANLKKEKRIKDQTEEMEREKIAMEHLKNQMEQEKQYQIDRRNRIKQAQYEDYNNYLRQKYSTPPQYREKLNIKLGGEQRNIKKPNYNEEMDNLCINPTTQKYTENPNVINYSEMGRRYQKGYSHGYNIITGEVYSENNYGNKNNINNINNSNIINDEYNRKEEIINERSENDSNVKNNKTISISQEEYEEFLKFKEMKRQKQLELERQQLEQEKYNNNNYINNNEIKPNHKYYEYEKPPKEYLNQYQNPNYEKMNERTKPKNNFHYEEQNEPPQRFDEIKEKENFLRQENKYYDDYQKRLLMQNQNQENNYPLNNRDYEQMPPNYYEEQNNQKRNEYEEDPRYIEQYNQYNEKDINNRQEYERQNYYGNNNEENEEQIQFKDNISFPVNQQMNPNEQNKIKNEQELINKYKKMDYPEEVKDIEREKYLQFLKEQSEPNNQARNYPPEEYYNEKEDVYNQQNNNNNYNNNNIPPNDYYQEKRELTPRTQREFLSYQEQIKRIKNQEMQSKYINQNQNPSTSSNQNISSEYNKNRTKNLNTNNNIFKREEPLKIAPKYNDKPLTEKEKKEIIQKDYAKYLEWQINEKNRNMKTPYNPRNYNPILDDNDYNEQIKQKENAMKDIPNDPYRNKNYDMNNRGNYGYQGNDKNNYMKNK